MNRRRDDEAGFTLIEALIAMVLISIGVVGVLGALQFGIESARVQRELAEAQVTLRSAAEEYKATGTVSDSPVDVDPLGPGCWTGPGSSDIAECPSGYTPQRARLSVSVPALTEGSLSIEVLRRPSP